MSDEVILRELSRDELLADCNRLRTQLAEANEKAANLEDERVAVHTWGEEQKRRRVYYQDIVYAVCNILDSCWPATHVVCGTIDEASDEVQQAVVKLKDQLAESERKHRETLSLLGAFTDPSCYACDRIRREIVHVLHPTKAPPQENTEVTG